MHPLNTRRDFLRQVAAGAWILPAARPRRRISPNERIGIGIIGVGGLGGHHHLPAIQSRKAFRLVALCDVDRRHLEDAAKRLGEKVALEQDYRRLLDRKDIDAVLIATPDHWHAIQAIHACDAGKDVYCEKPLSLTIGEGRAMVNAARRSGRVFQTGTQQRSDRRFHQACSLVRNGAIGQVKEIRCVLGEGPLAKPLPNSPPPPELDWNLWLGPAPFRDYNRARCHYTFRWFFDTSGGKLTDWGAHHLDIAQWGLGTEFSGPVEIEGRGVFPADNAYEVPHTFEVRYRYGNGAVLHALSSGENGVRFDGEKGWIFVSRSTIRSEPKDLLQIDLHSLPIQLERSANHHDNFIACVKNRRRPISDVELGHRSATICHLGNIAIRLGRKIDWNPGLERSSDPIANRLIQKPMRHPFGI